MLILGAWLSLFLYTLSWIASLNLNPSRFSQLLDTYGTRLGWLLHTVVLLGTLFIVSSWPSSFVSDLLNVVAWSCVVISQAFPNRWLMLPHASMLRVFSILLLGLSTSIIQVPIPALELIHSQTWLYQTVLGTHIISFLAGYVLFGMACVASILFLYQEHQLKAKLAKLLKHRFPALGTLDRTNVRATQWGFVALTVGLILGMMMAEGPRSGLSAVRLGLSMGIWCLYAILLLLRELRPVYSRWFVMWPIVGFVMIMMALAIEIHTLSLAESAST